MPAPARAPPSRACPLLHRSRLRGRARRSPTIDPPARRAEGSSSGGRGGTGRPRSWRGPRRRSRRGRHQPAAPSRRSSVDANATVHPPSARNPAVITCGSVASRAASPLMCSCRTWYSSCRRCASSQAAVKAAGPRIPQAAPRRPDCPPRHRRGVRRCADAATRGSAAPMDREGGHRGWFRAVDVTGLERIPRTGPVLLVASHHGGFVDPALLVAVIPRPIRFLAMGTLFRNPLLRALLSFAGTLPIHRAQDRAGRRRDGRERAHVRGVLRPSPGGRGDRHLPRGRGKRRATPPAAPHRCGSDRDRRPRAGNDGAPDRPRGPDLRTQAARPLTRLRAGR